jgi:hypothetical protein
MQGRQPCIGSEQRIGVRICEKETREIVDLLWGSLPSLSGNTRRPDGEATASNDAVERVLISACRHLAHSKGSVQMSTWLTAIALLLIAPDRAETPVPAVSNTGKPTAVGGGKRDR